MVWTEKLLEAVSNYLQDRQAEPKRKGQSPLMGFAFFAFLSEMRYLYIEVDGFSIVISFIDHR